MIFYDANDNLDNIDKGVSIENYNTQNSIQKPNNICDNNILLNSNSIINTESSKFYDRVYSTYIKRNRLEKPRLEVKFNVWSILKDSLGKDLNKMCVPGKIICLIYKLQSIFQ